MRYRRIVRQEIIKGRSVLPVHTLQLTVYVNVTTVLLKGSEGSE